MSPSTCPDTSDLQAILDDVGDHSDELSRHLDTCGECQRALETLAGDPAAWEEAAVGLGDAVWNEPALQHVVARLKTDEGLVSEEKDLSFLRPTDKPGVIGLFGSYDVLGEIGRGGMGVVLKALDPVLNRVVALKVLSPRLATSAMARQRFLREGRAVAAVCNEHIVAVHGVSEADGLPFLVMQYITGESLQDRLDRVGPLELEEIVQVGLQTAAGLAAAHARGLIHRDIKPANLLLEPLPPADALQGQGENKPRTRVKITDFGLARMTDDVQLTQNGVLAGTPEFMAPEQARGEPVDHRADLFSLGSVLYAMGTGASPFRGPTTLALIRQVSEETPAPLRTLNPRVPGWLETLVARLMAKDPGERFQSAAEVVALLDGYFGHLQEPATVPAPELPAPIDDSCREVPSPESHAGLAPRLHKPLWVGAFLLLASVALGLGAWFSGGAGQPVPETAKAQDPAPNAEQRPMKEIYQDFRGGKEFRAEFRLSGAADADKVTKHEPSGLRITLPSARPKHFPVEVCGKFTLFGDFDVTGTYELLSATEPTKGYGVGVALIVANNDKRDKFVKVGRLMRPEKEGVYYAEFWTKKPPEDFQFGSQPTKVRAGQLRIVRAGAHLRCLVADEVGKEFTVVFEVPNFGTEEMSQLRFEVTDGNSPNNPVDARLVDLRVRMQTFPPDKGAGPAPLPPQPVIPVDNPAPADAQSGRLGWLVASLVSCFVFTLLLACGAALLVFLRQRKASAQSNPPAAFGSLACPDCGRKLKIDAKLAGKKVKCPHCGKALVAPQPSRRP